MTSAPGGVPASAGRGVLRGGAALAAAAYAFVVTMAGTTLPTPLYPHYRAEFGFSQLVVTVIFATYAVGVIAALLLFGRLSDRIGRRATLLPGLAVSAASAVVFLLAGGLPALLVGRLLSGLSAGMFTGTATAAIVDLARPGRAGRAALLATVANMGGLGCGPVIAGLVAQFGPDPLRWTFVVDLALLVPAALAVLLLPETVSPAARAANRAGGGRLVSRPRVPDAARVVFVRAALAGFAGFAVLGMFTAVSPAFLGQVLHQHDPLVTGLVVAAVFAASAAGQALARRTGPAAGLWLGCGTLLAGLVAVALALVFASLPLLVVAGVVTGAGQGLSFAAGLGALLAAAPPAARGETSSAFFVVAYVAISVPVVGIGVLAELTALRTAGLVFIVVVAALVVTVLALLRRSGTRGGAAAG
ncbi:MFS transporter [Frankia sp. AgB1.9]|nr:MFS transporter [Frankia sp. AgW1.1]MBL7552187.1 MFS transporter [Frankia sp. AgB1.9]MBL7624488.1 MFS transporter [Frankia sp. AgB1.8]